MIVEVVAALAEAGVGKVVTHVTGIDGDRVILEPWGFVATSTAEAVAFARGVAAQRLAFDEADRVAELRGAGKSLADTLEAMLAAYDHLLKQAQGKSALFVQDVSGARGILEICREVVR